MTLTCHMMHFEQGLRKNNCNNIEVFPSIIPFFLSHQAIISLTWYEK